MMNRFDMSSNQDFLLSLSDYELAKEINKSGIWEFSLLRELMWRADMLEEWIATDDGEYFEEMVRRAADRLGVIIDSV